MLIMGVFSLSIPIWIRWTVLILNQITEFEYKFKENSLNNNDIWYPIYYVLYISWLELLPMGLQFLWIRMAISSRSYRINNGMALMNFVLSNKLFYRIYILYNKFFCLLNKREFITDFYLNFCLIYLIEIEN